MDKQPNTFGNLVENAGDYLETRLDLLKLQAINKSTDVTSSLVSSIVVLLIFKFAMFILHIGLALWIGELLGKVYLGFFVLGGFYFVLAILLYFFRHSWLKEPLSSLIIKKMLN